MMIRTFIALEIPENALSQILLIREKCLGNLKNVKWEPKEKLHLTLKFIGDTRLELLNKYSEAIEKIAADHSIFELNFTEFGIFKNPKEPRIFWAGLNESPKLFDIVNNIETAFLEFGFEKEKRKFKPHITLLRFRGHEDVEKILSLTYEKISEINFVANRITFYESKLLQSGSVYKSIQSFYLKN